MPWARLNTEYSIHWVQHTQSTAYTEYYIHRILHQPMMDQLPLPASLSSLGRPCCTQFSTFAQLRVDHWIESQLLSRLAPSWITASRMNSSWYASNLTRSWPPSASSNWFDHRLQVYLQSCTITATTFPQSPPSSVSPNSLDHGLQVHLQTGAVTAFKCISNLVQLRHWSPHDHRLEGILKFIYFRPPKISPNSLDYGLGVNFKVHSIKVWWNGVARRRTAHLQHSNTSRLVSQGISWQSAVPAQWAEEVGGRIWRDTRL